MPRYPDINSEVPSAHSGPFAEAESKSPDRSAALTVVGFLLAAVAPLGMIGAGAVGGIVGNVRTGIALGSMTGVAVGALGAIGASVFRVSEYPKLAFIVGGAILGGAFGASGAVAGNWIVGGVVAGLAYLGLIALGVVLRKTSRSPEGGD